MDADEEINAVDRTNVKKMKLGSGSDLGKTGSDDPPTKLKRKARVLVEVKSVDVFLMVEGILLLYCSRYVKIQCAYCCVISSLSTYLYV